MPRRWLPLPAAGPLLVSTDLHGNAADFRRLCNVFGRLAHDAHWVILGDAVHGPSDEARRRQPDLYDYPDESGTVVAGIAALQERYPGQVHFVLGNHDYGHVGGPHTHKFHADEVAHLEGRLSDAERAGMQRLFRDAMLAVVAPCGALLTHGSPDDSLRRLEDLDAIDFPPGDPYLSRLLDTFLTSYGQQGEVTERLLATVSASAGTPVRFVIHGHDRDPQGWFVEGGNQLCPVLFGAPDAEKRYVLLDGGRRYRGLEELRDGVEIRRLYGAEMPT